jgi:hypothetical protein
VAEIIKLQPLRNAPLLLLLFYSVSQKKKEELEDVGMEL